MTVLTGILGGTFDPIHLGHIAIARTAAVRLSLSRTLLVPSRVPPHRPTQPAASTYHRFAMVALATLDQPGFEACDVELRSPSPSYTAATLDHLSHEGLDPLQLVFIVGADAFAEIATWWKYPEFLDRAHFAVVSRPGCRVDALRTRLPDLAARMEDVRQNGPLTMSFDHPRLLLIDADTPDVSSTLVRDLVARAEPLTGLVPPAVAAYIRKTALYRPMRDPAADLQERP